MRLAWITDPHLESAITDKETEFAFYESISDCDADAFVVTGDISSGAELIPVLRALITRAERRPVYFVLGNHDYYYGNIEDVRYRVASEACEWRKRGKSLVYLTRHETFPNGTNDHGFIQLTRNTALIGVDGWGDGHAGESHASRLMLRDFEHIGDLIGARAMGGKFGLFDALAHRGRESAEVLRRSLAGALVAANRIIVATHVPPFREAAVAPSGNVSDDDWAPFMVCQATGDLLVEYAETYPDHSFTVLCGHTHGEGETQVLDNLKVLTGPAEYGNPQIRRILELD